MFKELKYFLLLEILPPVVYLVLLMLRATLRVSEMNRDAVDTLWRGGETVIACFWHGRLLGMPFLTRPKAARVLISRHRDGEFIARVVRFFGIGAVRASYQKATVSAMREILTCLRKGVDIAVTPDGPKGPGYKVKKGIVELARLSGRPIVPVAYSARKKKPSAPGTGSYSPTLSRESSLSGEVPSMCLITQMTVN